MKRRVFTSLIIMMLVFTTTAQAHKPMFEGTNSTYERPVVVPDHKISYVVYGELKDERDIDFIKFTAKKGDPLFVETAIPKINGNEDFRPYIAIAGKGIYSKDRVPFNVVNGMGVTVIPPAASRDFYEKFTQTSYYLVQSLRGEITEDGDYYIAVYSVGRGGKYSLAIGEREDFGFSDVIKFPYTYIKVKYFFNPVGTIAIIVGLAVSITGIILIMKRVRGR
ncbi:hypothetical protein [Fonticella tunisiensis]|uniref:Uncharacterized protein n=1 Tax=Fonticella tunisiensis TaxID=1096341 RepID=A0A4R7K9J1_9CLOT|nr:hypothetical protein [Fonticella tunisiensis]TDT47639.1 hypothetical protein EDD71_13425 [Fonticella tunisiensis]